VSNGAAIAWLIAGGGAALLTGGAGIYLYTRKLSSTTATIPR